MHTFGIVTALVAAAHAARPFLEEPDTGLDRTVGDLAAGLLPNLTDMVCLHDFDWAARNYLPALNYTYCMPATMYHLARPLICWLTFAQIARRPEVKVHTATTWRSSRTTASARGRCRT